MSENRTCDTCQIAYDERGNRNMVECPLKKYREVLGYEFIKTITERISCSAWVVVKCCQCGKPLYPPSGVFGYIHRPYCGDCRDNERYLDDQA